MNKIKIAGLTLLMALSSTVFAQEKSEVVMTKAELESFLEKVADARRAQLKAERQKKDKAYLSELRLRSKKTQKGFSNAEVLRELDRINMRLDYMTYGTTTQYRNGGHSSTIVVPGSNGNPTYVPSQQQYIPTPQVAPNNDKKIWELERQLAELKAEKTKEVIYTQPKTDSGNNGQLTSLQNELNALKAQLSASGSNTEQTTEVRREMLAELLAKFKNFKKQVFFANNSDQLSPSDYAYIQDVTKVLRDYPELSIILEGWASAKGNPEYNKQLSMRRAESVEKALLNNGIDTRRIVSSFRGEDTSTSEAMARRVDMSVILK